MPLPEAWCARRRLACLAAGPLLALVAACAGPPVEPPPAAGAPLSAQEYERLLAQTAGGPVSVSALVEEAARARREIGQRMDRLAGEIRPGTGWRKLFAELRREVPAGREELLAAYRSELESAAAFVAARRLVTLPPEQPEVMVLENAALRAHFPLGLYYGGRFAITLETAGAAETVSFENHCRICIPPLAVHEGYPGHHVALWRFLPPAGEPPQLARLARYKPYVEGWGLYAEVLMLEQGYYAAPERRLGAWRLVLLRALRAELDARLHGSGMTAAEAEESYRRELLASPEAAAAEVRVHLAKPAVKASYFVGLLQILELRHRLGAGGESFDWQAFHDRLLGPPAALPAIARERFGVELGPAGETPFPRPWSEISLPPAAPNPQALKPIVAG